MPRALNTMLKRTHAKITWLVTEPVINIYTVCSFWSIVMLSIDISCVLDQCIGAGLAVTPECNNASKGDYCITARRRVSNSRPIYLEAGLPHVIAYSVQLRLKQAAIAEQDLHNDATVTVKTPIHNAPKLPRTPLPQLNRCGPGLHS